MASRVPSPSEYHNSLSCWSVIDEILPQCLNVLHHSLGCDVVDPIEAAEMFSNTIRDVLLEYEVIVPGLEQRGPHRQRPVESTLRNLSQMQNADVSLLTLVSMVHLYNW